MRRGPFRKTWVTNSKAFWTVKAKAGVYELQQNDNGESIWGYTFRIVEVRDHLPARVVATANAPDEIGLDWQHFTDQSWRP